MAAEYDKQQAATAEYVKKHRVQELFSHLLQLVVYHRPENPRQFMSEELRKLKGKKETHLFTEDELDMMFRLVDVTNQGSISLKQLRHAYANLSMDGEQLAESALPKEVLESGRVNKEQFKAVLGAELQTKNHWASA